MHRISQLASVLSGCPQRNALHNLALSSGRADTVRSAPICQAIAMERVSARGHGATSPMASNANATGRQLNRRLAIVLPDDHGRLIARQPASRMPAQPRQSGVDPKENARFDLHAKCGDPEAAGNECAFEGRLRLRAAMSSWWANGNGAVQRKLSRALFSETWFDA